MSAHTSEDATEGTPGGRDTVAVVIVTYNRAELLGRCLDGLAALERAPDEVLVVDNASTDGTAELLADRRVGGDLPLRVLDPGENLGGAGGFHLGMRTAHEAGHDWIWLMDDDVVPAPGCLTALLQHAAPAMMAVREDRAGRICEKAATVFDLRNPLAIRAKRESVEQRYPTREQMPVAVPIQNVAFEGFMVHRRVVDRVGLPDASFFIFYDDVDFAIRVRRAGYPVVAVRDAVLVRQLDFDQQHDMRSWKGFYMYRNLFVVHFRYGENPLVRLKPYLITLAVLLLSPLHGGRAQAANVTRALRSARGMHR